MSDHACEIRPRKDHRGVDLIFDALPFGRLWCEDASAAVDYAKHRSRSHDSVIRVYDATDNVIETLEYKGDFERVMERLLNDLQRHHRMNLLRCVAGKILSPV